MALVPPPGITDAMNSNDTGEDDDDGVYDDDDGSSVNMLEDGPLTRELDAEW